MSTTSVMGNLVGSRVKRKEDLRVLTGSGRYVDDVNPRGLKHLCFLRSPHAHARIVNIDTSAAMAMDGVVDVITGAEMAELTNPVNFAAEIPGLKTPTYPVLAVDRVRFVGEPVAVVVADSRYLAEDALDRILVEYEPLEAVMTMDRALTDGAPQLFDDCEGNLRFERSSVFGDVDGAFAAADKVVTETFEQHRWTPVPMETRGAVATYDRASGMLEFEGAIQSPHLIRFVVSTSIGHPIHMTRVIGRDVGGGFGLKWSPYREDIAICAVAKRVGGAVKWIEDRNENLVAGGQAREETLTLSLALKNDGTILGLKVDMALDHGAYPIMPPATVFTGLVRTTLPAPYRVPAYQFDERIVFTNKASYVSLRGPWAVETLVRERMLDLAARELGISQVDIRARNMITLEEQPTTLVTEVPLDNITTHETFKRALDLVDFDEVQQRLQEQRAEGRIVGFGIASFIEPAPGTPEYWAAVGFPFGGEPSKVRIEPDGHVSVYTAQMPHGQSHETTLAQLVGDELGVPFENIRLVYGDTQSTPFSLIGTGGSRAATMASGGVVMAARVVKQKVLDIASKMLEVSPEDLEIEQGVIQVKGSPEVAVPLVDLAMGCYMAPAVMPQGVDLNLEGQTVYDGEGGGFSQATHCCWVEIDGDTGQVKIERFLSVEDCGTMINPGIVEGQVHGAVAMGIGGMLYEHAKYDESSGQYLAGTFMDYLLPTAMEVPEIEIDHLEFESEKVIGSRGVGEGGTVLAPAALTNAIEDAIIAAGGQRVTRTPLTPTRVLELLGTIPAES
jgi:aerobic carbon-monoxide dehydrogenase large subunit